MMTESDFGAYNVDVCLVIDKTGSMQPIMDVVKYNALNLYHDILDSLERKGKHVGQFRIRVIWFGDYLADERPMLLSKFMVMPDEISKYHWFVSSIRPEGGGDDPEDGLEALAYAIRSPWCRTGWKRRHIIALFSDAAAHPLGFGKADPNYPKAHMPRDFAELSEMWGDSDFPGEMDSNAKRLLLFTPDDPSWMSIARGWDNTIHRSVKEATGLSDVNYQAILDAIANSV